jgi:RNA polymerase sigma-70 factor (ECF subfamily)
MGNPEIAEALGVSVEAVESLLARGRRRLAAALSAHRAETG